MGVGRLGDNMVGGGGGIPWWEREEACVCVCVCDMDHESVDHESVEL